MQEEIYMDDLDCPHCDWDRYNESWDIKVDPYNRQTTILVCDHCGKRFIVDTELTVTIKKVE